MHSLRPEIIVGIDFGTTHSGVSWAINEGQKKIRLITDWTNPHAQNANQDKVPSVISYKNGEPEKWGYEVMDKEESFKWIKVLLDSEFKYSRTVQEVRDSNALLKKLNKSAEEVVRDYLKLLWRFTKDNIRMRIGDDDWESMFNVHVVLTVPAMWSPSAKDKTLKAARGAGLPQNMQLVTEPEAAALATIRDKVDENSLSIGDTFVVCDAGGGTVDLISYKVNDTNPLDIEECAIGDGGLCGSIFLDTSFEKHIRTLVGDDQYARIKPIHKKRMMRMFEYGVKRSFTLESTNDFTVELRGVDDNPDEGIEDESINLKRSMLRTVFDYVCGQIDNLVQEQVNQVQDRRLSVTAILLVGGFGSSKYLHQRLEKSYASMNVKVLQVEGAWSAICRGACLWGLEHTHNPARSAEPKPKPTVSSRISKYSYGIAWNVPFNYAIHDIEDRLFDNSQNQWVAKAQMKWLLKRGDAVPENEILDLDVWIPVHGVGFFSSGKQPFSQVLLYSESAHPPSRLNENVKQLCSVGFVLSESTIRQERSYRSKAVSGKWRNVNLSLFVLLKAATLEFSVFYKHQEVGCVEVKYMEDF